MKSYTGHSVQTSNFNENLDIGSPGERKPFYT